MPKSQENSLIETELPEHFLSGIFRPKDKQPVKNMSIVTDNMQILKMMPNRVVELPVGKMVHWLLNHTNTYKTIVTGVVK